MELNSAFILFNSVLATTLDTSLTLKFKKANIKHRDWIDNDVKKGTNLKQQLWPRYKNKPTHDKFWEMEEKKTQVKAMIKHKKQEFFEHKILNSYEKKPREFYQTVKKLKDCHEPKIHIDKYPTPAKFNSFFVKVQVESGTKRLITELLH